MAVIKSTSKIPKTPGAYQIIDSGNHIRYVGSSSNLYDRHQDHCWRLKRNIHDNPKLQSYYNRNPNSLLFNIVATKDREIAFDLEQQYLNELHGNGYLFNIAKDARKPAKGATLNENHKQALLKANTGRVCSNETRKKISASNMGKTVTEDFRKHMSNVMKGKAFNCQAVIINGVEYPTVKSAAKELNIAKCVLFRRLKSDKFPTWLRKGERYKMQINVIHAPTLDSLELLLYPEQHPSNLQYIQNQFTTWSESLTEAGKKFMEDSKALYEKLNDSNALRMAKAALRMTKGLFHPNQVMSLETLDDLRTAQPIMQRYIMACPDIRTLYHEQRVDGYSDTYVDLEPKKVGNDHYDYRRVMSGMIVENIDEDGDDTWSCTTFAEEARSDERDLDFTEKTDIIRTWDLLRYFLDNTKADPTSIFGDDIGGK